MKYQTSKDFWQILVSSIVLSILVFFLVSLWQLGKVSARGNEPGITLITEPSTPPSSSPFAKLNKPKFYKPASLSIPQSGIESAVIVEVGLEPQNRLGVPVDFDTVGWFKDGAMPGESGNAIFDGHYDRADGSPAVFYKLGKLSSGDLVSVTDERGRVLNFVVFETSFVSVKDPVSAQKAFAGSDEPIMTLITCGGVWNAKEKNYSQRLLVKAKLIKYE